jgi:hypothetical protein
MGTFEDLTVVSPCMSWLLRNSSCDGKGEVQSMTPGRGVSGGLVLRRTSTCSPRRCALEPSCSAPSKLSIW